MIQNEKFETILKKPRVLFSALDWGLGHTTRSIPIIQEFLNQGCDVIIACNSIQKSILKPEFPELEFVSLEGYNVTYANHPLITKLKLAFQIKNILTRIKFEYSWISIFFSKNTVDAIVSDNRYGFRSAQKPSVFITHQLEPRSGAGKMSGKLIQFYLYKWINKFDECWVPDEKNEPFIAGGLSHPKKLPAIPVKYLGGISRFSNDSSIPIIYEALIILSGPEPQRGILEKIILGQLKNTRLKIAVVRGLPANSKTIQQDSLFILNHAPAKELNELILQSSIIISRSGYTTIMDLLKLQKKMILIPTPGQPEQEYLASYLSSKKMALTVKQSKFSLINMLDQAKTFEFVHLAKKMDDYKLVVQQFVSTLKETIS